MQYILNSGQMKQCDANTMERYGMLSAVLMERAALTAAEEALRYLPETMAGTVWQSPGSFF